MGVSKSIFAIGVFIIVISCKKDDNAYGTVLEEGTNNPIEGATVIMQYWKNNCASCPYNYDSVYTDAGGRFSMNFKTKSRYRYSGRIRDNNHYGFQGITIGDKNKSEYKLYAFAYIKFHLKKRTNSRNRVSVDRFGIYLSHPDSPIDTVFPVVTRVEAVRPLLVDWRIFQSYPDDPKSASFQGEVIIGKNDTLIYVIQYD